MEERLQPRHPHANQGGRGVKDKYMWAGFVNGKILMETCNDYWKGENIRPMPMLFRTKKEAMEQFVDVRKIKISEVVK